MGAASCGASDRYCDQRRKSDVRGPRGGSLIHPSLLQRIPDELYVYSKRQVAYRRLRRDSQRRCEPSTCTQPISSLKSVPCRAGALMPAPCQMWIVAHAPSSPGSPMLLSLLILSRTCRTHAPLRLSSLVTFAAFRASLLSRHNMRSRFSSLVLSNIATAFSSVDVHSCLVSLRLVFDTPLTRLQNSPVMPSSALPRARGKRSLPTHVLHIMTPC